MGIAFDLKKAFDAFHLNISMNTTGRRIGILGSSGSGKSMTLKMIAGILSPDSGFIRIGDHVLYDAAEKINVRPQKRRVGYLFQNYALFPTMTVAQNIACGMKGSRQEKEARAARLIREFHLEGLEGHLPSELSGGQQQRTALARMMAPEPDVILLDEPFSALDGFLRDRMQHELVQFLNRYEGTMVMVSHDRDEIYRICEELLIIKDGQAVAGGVTRHVFENPGTRTAAELTGCKNFSAAKRLDDHSFRALDWDVTIRTRKRLPDSFDCIGYRAHEFVPVWGTRGENCIAVQFHDCAELQFEKKYYAKAGVSEGDGSGSVNWFAQRELWEQLEARGMPEWLQLREEHIMYLRQD